MSKRIFFIHGLSGTPQKTWGEFPDYLKEKLDSDYSIGHLSYKSPPFWKFWESAPSLLKIADARIEELKQNIDLEHDEVVLIGHSNGGVVIKKILQRLESRGIAHNIQKIVFLDVPHNGSAFANAGTKINPRNKHLRPLMSNSEEQYEVNDFWTYNHNYLKFETLNLIAEDENIVSSQSAKYIYSETRVVPGSDHGSIAKPKTKEDYVVCRVVEFIKRTSSLDKYRTKSSENYEGWLAHDNGRAHRYDLVLDITREENFNSLYSALEKPNSIIRITGLSGLGKSRLIIECIKHHEEIEEDNILVFNATRGVDDIKISIKKAIKDEASGLIILEHCEKELHDYIAIELKRGNSKLRIITVNYYNDNVVTSPQIHLTQLDDESVQQIIRPILPLFDSRQLEKIVSFVEGFPLLAILLAERFQSDGVLSPNVTDEDFADKLINADGTLEPEHKRILQACSLFDVFGVEQEGIKEADFIINLAKSNRQAFGVTLCKFEGHKIINRVGRFARVVPKPLAVHLASRWWEENIHDELEELINTLPESLLGSFCTQIKYLDSSPKVQAFVSRLCEPCSPFGRPELLFSTKGSRLFRALVEVNPNATSNLIYRALSSLDNNQLQDIQYDSRRNLVWSLEMLVFHKSEFEKSAWCLYKLALNENESYGNNATGQFTQLFKCYLSGTEANFDDRVRFLERVSTESSEASDALILAAVNVAFDTYSSSRIIGAEYQGTKAVLQEWQPSGWEDIHQYWNKLINLLSTFINGQRSVEEIKKTLGFNLRSLIQHSNAVPISSLIEELVQSGGAYWPEAVQSLKDISEFDISALNEQEHNTLKNWQELLSPAANNWEEKLKLFVLNPPHSFTQDENGEYIDAAAEKASALAREIDSKTMIGCLPLLLDFPEQKQTGYFAREFVIQNGSDTALIEELFKQLRIRQREHNLFLKGYLSGLNIVSPKDWEKALDNIAKDPNLQSYFCEAMITGKFTAIHLSTLEELVRQELISDLALISLTYGRVTEHIRESEIAEFCNSIASMGGKFVWLSLDIMYMYSRVRNDLDSSVINPVLSDLILAAPFTKHEKVRSNDGYGWLQSANKLLSNLGSAFAVKLTDKILTDVITKDVDYSDLWDWLNPAFYETIKSHGEDVWSSFEEHCSNLSGIEAFRLQSFLKSRDYGTKKHGSVITLLPQKALLKWCENEEALLLVARSIPIIELTDDTVKQVTPLLLELLEKFGNNTNFIKEIMVNYHCRGWSGSLIPILHSDLSAFTPFIQHPNANVRTWAKAMVSDIEDSIKSEQKREDEDMMFRN